MTNIILEILRPSAIQGQPMQKHSVAKWESDVIPRQGESIVRKTSSGDTESVMITTVVHNLETGSVVMQGLLTNVVKAKPVMEKV